MNLFLCIGILKHAVNESLAIQKLRAAEISRVISIFLAQMIFTPPQVAAVPWPFLCTARICSAACEFKKVYSIGPGSAC